MQDLWDVAARPRPSHPIRPRPARRSVDLLVAAFERMHITEGQTVVNHHQ